MMDKYIVFRREYTDNDTLTVRSSRGTRRKAFDVYWELQDDKYTRMFHSLVGGTLSLTKLDSPKIPRYKRKDPIKEPLTISKAAMRRRMSAFRKTYYHIWAIKEEDYFELLSTALIDEL